MEFYERQTRGLGLDIEMKVEQAVTAIQRRPESWPPHKRTGFRKYFVDRFPFIIFYMDLPDSILDSLRSLTGVDAPITGRAAGVGSGRSLSLLMPATILIVDDEKHTRDGLRMSFEDEFDVYVAADKGEALEVLRNDAIDVMVTDLRLGADDGMEVIEAALQMPKPPVCIMMTAYGSVDTAVEAMKRGAYHFVTKPLNIDELEILIKRALKSRGLEQENISLKRQVSEKVLARPVDRVVRGDEAGL